MISCRDRPDSSTLAIRGMATGEVEPRDILRVEDCVTATPWDADGDGIDELVVRTRWPEKPYAVYDIPEGELKPQLVSWPDTVPEEIRENLTCIWEQ